MPRQWTETGRRQSDHSRRRKSSKSRELAADFGTLSINSAQWTNQDEADLQRARVEAREAAVAAREAAENERLHKVAAEKAAAASEARLEAMGIESSATATREAVAATEASWAAHEETVEKLVGETFDCMTINSEGTDADGAVQVIQLTRPETGDMDAAVGKDTGAFVYAFWANRTLGELEKMKGRWSSYDTARVVSWLILEQQYMEKWLDLVEWDGSHVESIETKPLHANDVYKDMLSRILPLCDEVNKFKAMGTKPEHDWDSTEHEFYKKQAKALQHDLETRGSWSGESEELNELIQFSDWFKRELSRDNVTLRTESLLLWNSRVENYYLTTYFITIPKLHRRINRLLSTLNFPCCTMWCKRSKRFPTSIVKEGRLVSTHWRRRLSTPWQITRKVKKIKKVRFPVNNEVFPATCDPMDNVDALVDSVDALAT